MERSTLSVRLKKAREKSGLSQLEAAKKLEISNGTLSGYERDYRDPDTRILQKMADLYEVTVDYLLGRTSQATPTTSQESPLDYYKNKIITEFPDIDLMFKDLESFSAEDMKEVYEYIKFKKSQKDN